MLEGFLGGREGIANQNSQQFDTSVLLRAIDGNTSDVRALAQTLNCDFNRLSDSICSIKGGIDKVAGEIGISAAQTINAI